MRSNTSTLAQTAVTRNTLWNLAGSLLPVPFALSCIPVLVGALGLERFGLLGIIWVVLGYFSLFDFGLSRGTTKFIAEKSAHAGPSAIAAVAWGSVIVHGVLGLTGGALFVALMPGLVTHVFLMPASLTAEATAALYWLALSIPAIVVTSALRGILEGLQRFDLVNLIKTPAGIVNYLGPVLALPFDRSLVTVVAVIAVARFMVLIAHATVCLRVLPAAAGKLQYRPLLQIAAFGGWLTVSNIVGPLTIAADRFVIAAAVSVGAVAYYVTPYEIITKAWILSASLMTALFPILATMAANRSHELRPACREAAMLLLALTAPAIGVVLGCADLLLAWWLGPEFSANSTAVAHFLAVGILFNVVAQVPLTALQACGRADVTAKLALIEFPLYAGGIWYFARSHGVNGVAAVWCVRAFVDACVLLAISRSILPHRSATEVRPGLTALNIAVLAAFLASFWLAGAAISGHAPARVALVAALLTVMLAWEWRSLLRPENRIHLAGLMQRKPKGAHP
jgi:O-antigen/teichoic acid export membrane protein